MRKYFQIEALIKKKKAISTSFIIHPFAMEGDNRGEDEEFNFIPNKFEKVENKGEKR